MARILKGLALSLMLAIAAPALAQVAPPTPVEQTSLSRDAFATGALSPAQGALPPGLWKGADAKTLSQLLEALPSRPAGPSLGEALKRVLLSAGEAPDGATAELGGRKLIALVRAGFLDEARTIASLSSAPRNEPHVGEALAMIDLLDGAADGACRRNAALTGGRDNLFWVKLRVLCYVAAGERDAADLTYGLLRDRGALSDADGVLLSALVLGAAPKAPVAPETALHLAAVRALSLPLSPGLLRGANGGVLKAVARDGAFDAQTRVAAATRAAAIGALTPQELEGLFGAIELDVSEVAGAGDAAASRPNDPMTDVLLYQSVAQMTAPEFLRDKAARISEAIAIADTFPRAYAAALLYADEIKALEGALVPPVDAGRFALARMAVGDAEGAARWLFSMTSTGGVSALAEEEAMEFIALADLLAVLDPVSAELVADRGGVAIGASLERAPVGGDNATASDFAPIVNAAFDAALLEIPGQAGLAALAASAATPAGDPVGEVVVSQSLRAAGLGDLRRRMAFEAAWNARFAAAERTVPSDPMDAASSTSSGSGAPIQTEEAGIVPRIKPRARP